MVTRGARGFKLFHVTLAVSVVGILILLIGWPMKSRSSTPHFEHTTPTPQLETVAPATEHAKDDADQPNTRKQRPRRIVRPDPYEHLEIPEGYDKPVPND